MTVLAASLCKNQTCTAGGRSPSTSSCCQDHLWVGDQNLSRIYNLSTLLILTTDFLPINGYCHTVSVGYTCLGFLVSKTPVRWNHRIIESLRLEKTSRIKSNRQPNTTMPAKPCPVAYEHSPSAFWEEKFSVLGMHWTYWTIDLRQNRQLFFMMNKSCQSYFVLRRCQPQPYKPSSTSSPLVVAMANVLIPVAFKQGIAQCCHERSTPRYI